jgi:hypothetical protein
MYEHPPQHLVLLDFFILSLPWAWVASRWICISQWPRTWGEDVGHFVMSLLPLWRVCVNLLLIFLLGCLPFSYWFVVVSFLYCECALTLLLTWAIFFCKWACLIPGGSCEGVSVPVVRSWIQRSLLSSFVIGIGLPCFFWDAVRGCGRWNDPERTCWGKIGPRGNPNSLGGAGWQGKAFQCCKGLGG